jgi:hypothetical protein
VRQFTRTYHGRPKTSTMGCCFPEGDEAVSWGPIIFDVVGAVLAMGIAAVWLALRPAERQS